MSNQYLVKEIKENWRKIIFISLYKQMKKYAPWTHRNMILDHNHTLSLKTNCTQYGALSYSDWRFLSTENIVWQIPVDLSLLANGSHEGKIGYSINNNTPVKISNAKAWLPLSKQWLWSTLWITFTQLKNYSRGIFGLGSKMHMKNAKPWLLKIFSYLHIIWMQPPRVLVHVLT